MNIDINQTYTPSQAIVIYSDSDRNNFYLESHQIYKSDHGFALKEGKPLKKETLKKVVNAISKNNDNTLQCKYMIPSNLLFMENQSGSTTIAWVIPAEIQNLYFSKELNIPSGRAACPTLLFAVKNESLYVFALKSSKSNLGARLYHAPFHNIYDDGSVCLGNLKINRSKEKYFEDAIEFWQKAFWKTEFSSLLLDRSPIKGNLNSLWKKLINTNIQFPVTELKEHSIKNVKSLIDFLKDSPNDLD